MFFCRQLHVLLSFPVLAVSSDDFRIRLLWWNPFCIAHAAVANLDGVAVEYFSKFVVFVEVFVN